MAGIGFELRALLRRRSFLGFAAGYGYAGLIGSGPWIFSIVGVMAIGALSGGFVHPTEDTQRFLVCVTWLLATSLVATGALQMRFTRFVADRVYEGQRGAVLPNLLGALTLTSLLAGAASTAAVLLLFDAPPALCVVLVAGFVVLCDTWLLVVMLSGLKAYRTVVAMFFIGYAAGALLAVALRRFGTTGLLAGFVAGQAILLFLLLDQVMSAWPGDEWVSFAFLRRRATPAHLGAIGLSYNLAIWIDKLLFWMSPLTGSTAFGPLRHSIIYDLPIFLAYLSTIPGMAVFLVRVETDFAECHRAFYDAIRAGATLAELERLKDAMVHSVREGLASVVKVQGFTVLLLILAGPRLLELAGISPLYLSLLYVDLVGVAVQVLLLVVLNIHFYLDRRGDALALSLLFLFANAGLTAVTQHLGPAFYGYGFTVAVVLTALVGLISVSRALDKLEYRTFMLQG